MPRIPRAARTLIAQTRDRLNRNPDSKAGLSTAEPVDEPDGLGVYRTFKFDKVASKSIAPAMFVLSQSDDRLAEVLADGDILIVTFVPSTKADDPRPFALEDAETVVAAETAE